MKTLPKFHVEGNTIFVHAGIEEDTGDMWELQTREYQFTMKYPAEVGRIRGLEMKVVAGHIGTFEISRNSKYHDIFFDGDSHYYIDGTVVESAMIPVLMVDTKNDKYYKVTSAGTFLIHSYDEL